jgi:hypothetical protein
MRVLEYIREDGSSPYQKWFDGLNPNAAAKVTVENCAWSPETSQTSNGFPESANTELIGGRGTGFIWPKKVPGSSFCLGEAPRKFSRAISIGLGRFTGNTKKEKGRNAKARGNNDA